jgi:hypothetical protein
MTTSKKATLRGLALVAAVALGALLLAALPSRSQPASPNNAPQSTANNSQERWIHVRVDGTDSKEEKVRVNIPLELAEKVLPAINKDRLKSGKVKITDADMNGVDFHALMNAVRDTKDGEFVTVQDKENDVRVAKQNGYLIVRVLDKTDKKHMNGSKVEVKVPIKVVDALFSAGPDEIDLVAGLRALSASGDAELVSVKDGSNNVRVWLDSKNSSD